jgi:hypothetical protein
MVIDNTSKGDIMPSDWLRAFQQWVGNMMNSDLAYLITEQGLLTVVRTRKPNLLPYVEEHFGRVWRWVRDTYF